MIKTSIPSNKPIIVVDIRPTFVSKNIILREQGFYIQEECTREER